MRVTPRSSDDDGTSGRSETLVAATRYVAWSFLCAVFSIVLEFAGNRTYSAYLVGLFAVPLLAGLVPTLLLHVARIRLSARMRTLSAVLVCALCVACGLAGVFEVFGVGANLA